MMNRHFLLLPIIFGIPALGLGPHERIVPGPPERVHVTTTSNSATLWWDPPSDGSVLVRGYAIAYGIGSPSYKLIIEGEHSHTFTVNALKPNTTYVFAVNAYNEADGEDGERVLVSAVTLPTLGELREELWAPVGVHAIARPQGIDVSWEDPNSNEGDANRVGSHRHYLISYGIYQSEATMNTIRSNARSVRIVNVQPDREYEIAVKVLDAEGRESVWSIRDIVLTPKGPERNISQYDWACDFEKDFCGMESTEDGVEWVRERKGTRMTPVHGRWAAVADSSSTRKGYLSRYARLLTPTFNMAKSAALCLSTYLLPSDNMKGTVVFSVLDDKTQEVEQITRIETNKLWRRKWSRLRLKLERRRHPFKIVVEYSWSHDASWLALDLLELSSGVCQVDNVTLRLSHRG